MEKSTERISKMEDIKKKRKRKNRRPKRITNVIFFLDEFFKQLTLMYNGSKRWGSVRLNMKRAYSEHYGYKSTKKFKLLREEERIKEAKEEENEFGVLIRASTNKRKIAITVDEKDIFGFQKQLNKLISNQFQLLKNPKKKQVRLRDKQNKKYEQISRQMDTPTTMVD